MATAMAPIPLSSFAGEPSAHIGKSFSKASQPVFTSCVIVLACVFYRRLHRAADARQYDGYPRQCRVMYVGELLFNMLVLRAQSRRATAERELWG
jgi:hypothetical protein